MCSNWHALRWCMVSCTRSFWIKKTCCNLVVWWISAKHRSHTWPGIHERIPPRSNNAQQSLHPRQELPRTMVPPATLRSYAQLHRRPVCPVRPVVRPVVHSRDVSPRLQGQLGRLKPAAACPSKWSQNPAEKLDAQWVSWLYQIMQIAFLIDKDRWKPLKTFISWVTWSFWTFGGNVDFWRLQSQSWKGWQETSNKRQLKMSSMCQWWVLPGHLNKLMAGMEHSVCRQLPSWTKAGKCRMRAAVDSQSTSCMRIDEGRGRGGCWGPVQVLRFLRLVKSLIM